MADVARDKVMKQMDNKKKEGWEIFDTNTSGFFAKKDGRIKYFEFEEHGYQSELYQWLYNQRKIKYDYLEMKDLSLIFDTAKDFKISFSRLQEYAIFLREIGNFGDHELLWIFRFLFFIYNNQGKKIDYEKRIEETQKALQFNPLKEFELEK